MLRSLFIVCMLVLLGFVWPARSAPPVHAVVPPSYQPAGPGDVYLALGDSLATGTEADANNDGQPGYPAFLLDSLRGLQPELAYENLARDGESSAEMLAAGGQLDQALARIESLQAAGKQVGLVTLSIGGNDFLSILPPSSADAEIILAAFRTNFASILDRLLAALTDTNGVRQGDLVVMDYYHPYPGLELLGVGTQVDTWLPRFNAEIKAAAAARGVPVAEVAAAVAGNEEAYLYVARPYPTSLLDPQLEQKLDYHPRPAGHTAIASAFFTASGYQSREVVFLPQVYK